MPNEILDCDKFTYLGFNQSNVSYKNIPKSLFMITILFPVSFHAQKTDHNYFFVLETNHFPDPIPAVYLFSGF